jgi:uncharacterized coiled-coil protein SlyX
LPRQAAAMSEAWTGSPRPVTALLSATRAAGAPPAIAAVGTQLSELLGENLAPIRAMMKSLRDELSDVGSRLEKLELSDGGSPETRPTLATPTTTRSVLDNPLTPMSTTSASASPGRLSRDPLMRADSLRAMSVRLAHAEDKGARQSQELHGLGEHVRELQQSLAAQAGAFDHAVDRIAQLQRRPEPALLASQQRFDQPTHWRDTVILRLESVERAVPALSALNKLEEQVALLMSERASVLGGSRPPTAEELETKLAEMDERLSARVSLPLCGGSCCPPRARAHGRLGG